MTQAVTTQPTTITVLPKADHAHRWLIDEPNGPMSMGVCKVCGASKEFRNWIEQADYSTATERELAA
jgi:hypothetical protein